jgi:uncharacterized protein YbdZ (MbtH family)
MSEIEHTEYGIIVSTDGQFNIWPTSCKLLPGWDYSGPVGTQTEMRQLLEQQFISTLAATYLRPETRFGDPNFVD